MKKLLKILSTSAVVVAMVAGSAAAATSTITCSGSNTNTGSNSKNLVTCVNKNNESVSCVNGLVVTTKNTQTATSGDSFTTSGDATNNNTATVKVGATCELVASPTTTTSGGKGAGANVPSTSSQKKQVKAPTGAVEAGAGGASQTSTLAIAGTIGSLALIAGGITLAVVAKKRAN